MDLKIKDVAELLNVSETTIRRWLAEGKIPAYKIHHQYRFSRIEIENWVMSFKLKQGKGDFLPVEEQIFPPVPHTTSQDEDIVTETGVGQQQFSLFRAVHRGDVIDLPQLKNKEEVVKDVVKVIASKLGLDANVLSDLLLDRERLMPTTLNNGIAVPHTREFLIKRPFDVAVVVYPKQPLDWGSLDGQPVHSLFFLFACDDKRHLHLLAKIAHLTSEEANLDYLKSRPSKQALLEHIKIWESKVKQHA